MNWWAWLVLGAVLFGAEMLAIDAQFFLVFIGLSAALVGLLELAGVSMPEWAQWLLFSVLALVSMFTFRKSLYEKLRGGAPGFDEGMAGETLVVPSDLAAGGSLRASYRGSKWTVVNDGGAVIGGGERATILRREGLTLYVSSTRPDATATNEERQ